MLISRLLTGLLSGIAFGALSWLFFFLLKGANAGWGIFLILEPVVFYMALGGLFALLRVPLVEKWFSLITLSLLLGLIKSFSQQLAIPLFTLELYRQALPVVAEAMTFGFFMFIVLNTMPTGNQPAEGLDS